MCQYWLQGACSRMGCMYRHPSIPKPAPFKSFGGFAPPAAQGFPGAGGGGGGGVCVFYLAGQCRKGVNCPFVHPQAQPQGGQGGGSNGGRRQGRQQQQQQQQQQLQQQQPDRHQQTEKKRGKKEREQRPKRPLTEEEKQDLLNKPLSAPAGNSKSFVKKAAAPTPTVQPEAKKAKSSGAPIQIKSLAQIMAEKEGGKKLEGAAAPSPTSQAPRAQKKAPAAKQQSEKEVDDELLAMGLDPSDLVHGAGAAAGSDEDLDIEM